MRRVVPTLLLSLALLGVTLPMGASRADEGGEETGKLVLVLDSSGSMKEPTAGGTRIEAAKAALTQVVERLPDEAQVGIRVFGATVENRTQPGACRDTQNVVPVGRLDRAALTSAVKKYQPFGETPIGSALLGAAKDLGPATTGESRTIVLLSDGEPNCQPDPCTVARQLTAQGINLKINVVGLDVNPRARKALQCIARAGKGQYVDATSAEELAAGLVKVSVRDLRLFRLTGTRVQGGTSSADPLPLEAGTYVDTALPEEHKRYYLIDKPKGGGVRLAAMLRPEKSEDNWHTVLRVELTTPEGDRCVSDFAQNFQILGQTPLVSTGVMFNQLTDNLSDEQCQAADQLLATVVNESGPADYQLEVSTYPRLTNLDTLPPGLSDDDGPWNTPVPIPADGPTTAVVGGINFLDAPELTPGTTYSDTIRPSEQLVYKVPVKYGQAMHLTARLETDVEAGRLLGALGDNLDLTAVSPSWQQLSRSTDLDQDDFYSGEEPATATVAVPTVRVRNIEQSDSDVNSASTDGYAYVVLGLGKSSDEADNRFEAPVKLRAELVGKPAGEPEYDGTAKIAEHDSTAPAPATEPQGSGAGSDGGAGALPWALGGLGVVVVGAVAFVLGRRSNTDPGR